MNPPGQPPLPARPVLPPKLSPARAATGYSGSPDDDIAGVLTELFDAIMSTFRWGWENR